MADHRRGGIRRVLQRVAAHAAAVLVAAGGLEAQTVGRPNILWIIGEDLSPDLGVYGVSESRTPHLDGLARRGMTFTRAFATAPLCAPSRSAFNTGMYQTSIGARHQRLPDSLLPALPPGVQLVSERLRRAGYHTGNLRSLPGGERGTGKTDWGFRHDGRAFDTDRWSDLRANQPFYAQINLSESHRPYRGRRRADPAKVDFPPYYPDHPVTRADWARYLDDVTEMDRKVGVILEQLARDGLADNTVVFFFGDNGREMLRGKQWPYEEGLRVPLIVHWPERLPAPDGYALGIHDRLIELIDVTATTLALAGIEKPRGMHGRVFLGSGLETPRRYAFGAADRGGEVLIHSRTVRSARWRYVRNRNPEQPIHASSAYRKEAVPGYALVMKMRGEGRLGPLQRLLVAPRAPEELYDLEADPYELRNLAASPDHRPVLAELRAELDRWIAGTADPGERPDPREVVEFFAEYGRRGDRERAGRIERTRHQVHEVDEAYLRLLRAGTGGEP